MKQRVLFSGRETLTYAFNFFLLYGAKRMAAMLIA